LLELDLTKIFRSGTDPHPTSPPGGGSDNWAKHQTGNFDSNWSNAVPSGGDGKMWFGYHSGTTQTISKIHIGSTTAKYAATYSWGSLLGGAKFTTFDIQGSNNANIKETGARDTAMSGSWTTIMTVTEGDLYEPSPITDTASTATKGVSTSYIQGNNQTMRIIELPTG